MSNLSRTSRIKLVIANSNDSIPTRSKSRRGLFYLLNERYLAFKLDGLAASKSLCGECELFLENFLNYPQES
jgi:hypothetical protein